MLEPDINFNVSTVVNCAVVLLCWCDKFKFHSFGFLSVIRPPILPYPEIWQQSMHYFDRKFYFYSIPKCTNLLFDVKRWEFCNWIKQFERERLYITFSIFLYIYSYVCMYGVEFGPLRIYENVPKHRKSTMAQWMSTNTVAFCTFAGQCRQWMNFRPA